jgi:hypothetical protein
MRPSNKSRSRKSGNSSNNHNNRRSVGNIINRVFESAGPEGKVRGTPQQIIDKYQGLAGDAQVGNDRVAAESFQQHAEHYSRLLGEAQRQQMEQRVSTDRDDAGRQDPGRSDVSSEQSRPQPQPVTQNLGGSSGLTTIDPQEDRGSSGPVDTPESTVQRESSRPQLDRDPAHHDGTASQDIVNGAGPAAVSADGAVPQDVAPAKRPRTRRKAKVENDGAETPSD